MRRWGVRTLAWILVYAGAAVALLAAGYVATRVVPVVREVRSATAPLLQLGDRVVAYDAWAGHASALAERSVNNPSPAVLDSLSALMGGYDSLAGGLRLARTADVPVEVRILLAAAEETASRFAVTLEEYVALSSLGRRAEAHRRLQSALQLEARLHGLAAEAQARSIERVARARRAVESLGRRLLGAFAVWLVGIAVLLVLTFRAVRSRVEIPLRELQQALGRMAEGDLGVQLEPRFDDEIGDLAWQFNQMTAVLRSRAETQGEMAAAGVLLGNVAHEINNPLMAIGATAESRLADPTLPAPVRRDLEAVLEQVRRASRLVSGIVRFVREAPPSETRADVNDAAREAVELMGVQFAADGVECAFELGTGLPEAAATAHAVERILIALLANAHEALDRLPSGATRRVTVRTWAEGARVFVEVGDTGPGVGDEVRPRLFLPFAISPPGGHVGLGLYTARRIAREAGGDIAYEPRPDSPGAVFVVSLPAAPAVEAKAPEAAPAPIRRAAPAGLEGRRILLVDDEPMVRAPLARFLTRRGASVREAGDGLEALSVLAAEQPDVIVADLRMPGMDGAALFRAVREKHPALAARMLFLSGDVGQLGGGDESVISPERVLPKPVELAEFERFLLRHVDA